MTDEHRAGGRDGRLAETPGPAEVADAEARETARREREKEFEWAAWRPGSMVSYWNPAWDHEDDADPAMTDREWRALPRWQRAAATAFAVVLLGPIVLSLALIPVVVLADIFGFAGVVQTVDPVLMWLFIGGMGFLLLCTIIAQILAWFYTRGKRRPSDKAETE